MESLFDGKLIHNISICFIYLCTYLLVFLRILLIFYCLQSNFLSPKNSRAIVP